MDRLFAWEKEYCEDPGNIDGPMVTRAIARLCARNCDSARRTFRMETENPDLLGQIYQASELTGKRIVPVGTIEFVRGFLRHEPGTDAVMRPLEVPEALRPFLRKEYQIKAGISLTDEDLSGRYFVKDASVLKSWNNALNIGSKISRERIDLTRDYVVSQFFPYKSEWRVFVYRDEALGLECYQGDVLALPDAGAIGGMIRAYAGAGRPDAYTLDVGVRHSGGTKGGNSLVTEPVEVHPFAAVGLYGFYDTHLLDMWDAGYAWYLGHQEQARKAC